MTQKSVDQRDLIARALMGLSEPKPQSRFEQYYNLRPMQQAPGTMQTGGFETGRGIDQPSVEEMILQEQMKRDLQGQQPEPMPDPNRLLPEDSEWPVPPELMT